MSIAPQWNYLRIRAHTIHTIATEVNTVTTAMPPGSSRILAGTTGLGGVVRRLADHSDSSARPAVGVRIDVSIDSHEIENARVTVLATAGLDGAGWTALCRVVSATAGVADVAGLAGMADLAGVADGNDVADSASEDGPAGALVGAAAAAASAGSTPVLLSPRQLARLLRSQSERGDLSEIITNDDARAASLHDPSERERTAHGVVLLDHYSDVAAALVRADNTEAARRLRTWRTLFGDAVAVQIVWDSDAELPVAEPRLIAGLLGVASTVGVRVVVTATSTPGAAVDFESDTVAATRHNTGGESFAAADPHNSDDLLSLLDTIHPHGSAAPSSGSGHASAPAIESRESAMWLPGSPWFSAADSPAARTLVRLLDDAGLPRSAVAGLRVDTRALARRCGLTATEVIRDRESDSTDQTVLLCQLLNASGLRAIDVTDREGSSGIAPTPPVIGVSASTLADLHGSLADDGSAGRVCLVARDTSERALRVVVSEGPLGTQIPLENTAGSALPTSQLGLDELGLLGLTPVEIRLDDALAIHSHCRDVIARIYRTASAVAAAGGLGEPSDDAGVGYLDEDGVIDLDAIPLDDGVTFDALSAGHTIGLPGLDSIELRAALRESKPATLADLAETLAETRAESLDDDGDDDDHTTPPPRSALAVHVVQAYRSAWLKAHFPVELMAAALSVALATGLSQGARALLVSEARRMRIPLLALDINSSTTDYTVETVAAPRQPADEIHVGIRLPLNDVPGISASELQAITRERPFRSVGAVVSAITADRTTASATRASRALIERLALSGALDALGGTEFGAGTGRQRLLDEALARHGELARRAATPRSQQGKPSTPTPAQPNALFSADLVSPRSELDDRDSTEPATTAPASDAHPRDEYEHSGRAGDAATGSMAPAGSDASERFDAVDQYRPMLDDIGITPAVDLSGLREGTPVLVAGVRVGSQSVPTAGGHRELHLRIDDATAQVDAVLSEHTQKQIGPTPLRSSVILIQGDVTHGDVTHDDTASVTIQVTQAWDVKALWRSWKATPHHVEHELAG